MEKISRLCKLLIVFLIIVSIFIYSNSFNYNNNLSVLSEFNNRYSEEEITELEENIPFSNMYIDYSFWEFNLKYRPKCIRKTHVGYYAVLVCEDKYICFVFWDFENKIHSIYKTNGFVSSDKLVSSIIIGETNFAQIKGSNFDFFGYPSSKKLSTAHICTDGIIVVNYNDEQIAETVQFFSNEEIKDSNDIFLKVVPYILPKDRLDRIAQGTVSVKTWSRTLHRGRFETTDCTGDGLHRGRFLVLGGLHRGRFLVLG